ncbi:MAG: hypothetical protein RLZZ77_2260 [Bacteroidota bacterium]|jgi:hypothetical protein
MARFLLLIVLFTLSYSSSAQESPVVMEFSPFAKFSTGLCHAKSNDKAGAIFDYNGYRPNFITPCPTFHLIFHNRISIGLQYSFVSIKSERKDFAQKVDVNPQYQIVEASMPYTEKSQITGYRIRNHLLKLGIGLIHQKSNVKQKHFSLNLIFGYSRMPDLKVGISTIGTNEVISRVYRLNASPIFGLSFDFSSKNLNRLITTSKRVRQTVDSFGIEPIIWTTTNRVQYDEYNFLTRAEKVVSYRVFTVHYGFQVHYTFSHRIMGKKNDV